MRTKKITFTVKIKPDSELYKNMMDTKEENNYKTTQELMLGILNEHYSETSKIEETHQETNIKKEELVILNRCNYRSLDSRYPKDVFCEDKKIARAVCHNRQTRYAFHKRTCIPKILANQKRKNQNKLRRKYNIQNVKRTNENEAITIFPTLRSGKSTAQENIKKWKRQEFLKNTSSNGRGNLELFPRKEKKEN